MWGSPSYHVIPHNVCAELLSPLVMKRQFMFFPRKNEVFTGKHDMT